MAASAGPPAREVSWFLASRVGRLRCISGRCPTPGSIGSGRSSRGGVRPACPAPLARLGLGIAAGDHPVGVAGESHDVRESEAPFSSAGVVFVTSCSEASRGNGRGRDRETQRPQRWGDEGAMGVTDSDAFRDAADPAASQHGDAVRARRSPGRALVRTSTAPVVGKVAQFLGALRVVPVNFAKFRRMWAVTRALEPHGEYHRRRLA